MSKVYYTTKEKPVFVQNVQLLKKYTKLLEENERLKSEIRLLSRKNMELERENFRLQSSLLDNEGSYDER